MSGNFYKFANFPKHQLAITPADADFVQGPMIIKCLTAGNCIATDKFGVTITHPMVAGEVLPTLMSRVAAASTGTYSGHW